MCVKNKKKTFFSRFPHISIIIYIINKSVKTRYKVRMISVNSAIIFMRENGIAQDFYRHEKMLLNERKKTELELTASDLLTYIES
jgi:hypothetical protein